MFRQEHIALHMLKEIVATRVHSVVIHMLNVHYGLSKVIRAWANLTAYHAT